MSSATPIGTTDTTMTTTTIIVDAVLFDMDGTLIDSTPGVLKAWETFTIDYNLSDSIAIAHATHGRRLYDTLKEFCGITDEDRLLEEVDRFEDEVIKGGPTALPGAIDLLAKAGVLKGFSLTLPFSFRIVIITPNK
ncbi:hypothetical protein NLJ89_g11609 [Agrocybe chaxingu]|uniref:Uncharacterized protein n=1 Tax=Agrocybe chaxingu TaxID=84603 RepID=A0A9W8JVZ7_9AGAR|nr:hypothetical protein NLJ89_g11609 [Agrocybe chaxingu]